MNSEYVLGHAGSSMGTLCLDMLLHTLSIFNTCYLYSWGVNLHCICVQSYVFVKDYLYIAQVFLRYFCSVSLGIPEVLPRNSLGIP